MPVEIAHVQPEVASDFMRRAEREALKTLYDFSVIWHEERHDFVATDGEETIGAIELRVAASLGTIERIVVAPHRRLQGIGRALLSAAGETANYYNCHKMTVTVPYKSAAQHFFERCDYREEAVLRQHTFKLDMAVLRKFLL